MNQPSDGPILKVPSSVDTLHMAIYLENFLIPSFSFKVIQRELSV